jgi:putative DNA primase/helicase
MSALRSMAQALGGDVAGASVICPGPGHSPRDRSLSVTLLATAPDGFIVFSHAGDDWRACRAHVLERLGRPAGHHHAAADQAFEGAAGARGSGRSRNARVDV